MMLTFIAAWFPAAAYALASKQIFRAVVGIALSVCWASSDVCLAQTAKAPDNVSDTIEAVNQAPEDVAIKDRITGIFSAIDGLESIEVAASSGVVTLTGSVADDTNAQRAVSIAGRVAGVVTVENRIERDLSLDENLNPVVKGILADLNDLRSALPLVLISLTIAIAVSLVGHIAASIKPLWAWLAPNNFLANVMASAVRLVFIALGIFIALDILDATALLSAILGSAGVIGLAIGFAVRDTVDNYISSIMLSIRQPFRANDFVRIGTHEGRVVRLTSRATVLMTLDGNHLRVPNATVFKSEILNFTLNPERRFTFELGVDADDDPAAAVETGLNAINSLEFILRTPPAGASIKEVGDSNIVLSFNGWINQRETDFLKARGAAIRQTKIALEDNGFALPEPIYRLRFDGAEPGPVHVNLQKSDSSTAPSTQHSKPTQPPKPRPVDVMPDTHVENLVDEERASFSEEDLLDDAQKQE